MVLGMAPVKVSTVKFTVFLHSSRERHYSTFVPDHIFKTSVGPTIVWLNLPVVFLVISLSLLTGGAVIATEVSVCCSTTPLSLLLSHVQRSPGTLCHQPSAINLSSPTVFTLFHHLAKIFFVHLCIPHSITQSLSLQIHNR